MYRPQDDKLIETPANWLTFDPIIPLGSLAINSDGSGVKVGNGIDIWSDLTYLGAGAIRTKLIQSSRDPINNELLVFCSAEDKWVFRSQGCLDTETNWLSTSSVFPTMSLMIELNDLTNIPTGRFKISDGTTSFPTLPWFGSEFDLSSWPTGYSIEFNGTTFEAAHYIKVDELQVATTPTGKFHRDDGTWATISDTYVTGDASSTANNLAIFNDTTGKSIIDSNVNISDIPASTGTPSDSWQINSGSGPKLTNVGGDLKVYKNDGTTLANITNAETYSNYGIFATINVGFPTESSSVTLTSDGTYLYVDGGKIIDVNHDGHGSELDADTLDGFHASSFPTLGYNNATFPTVPATTVANNFVIFTTTDGLSLGDSGYNFESFATIAGSGGDVTGPTSSIAGNIATFTDTTGKVIEDSGFGVDSFATIGGTPSDVFQLNNDATGPILKHIPFDDYDAKLAIINGDSTDYYGTLLLSAIRFGIETTDTEGTNIITTTNYPYGVDTIVFEDSIGDISSIGASKFLIPSGSGYYGIDISGGKVRAITQSGLANFSCESITIVDNTGLNADTLDTLHASSFATVGHTHSYCRWRGSSATDPSDPLGGDIYYKTGDSKTYIYNGTTWDMLN